eukprot:TRINITY_DN65342_c0_g1_i1.p1 TRINITY_DN65342_c0_g1~~TRINITY_DN65342_c0_g1_i1.p1  ORF type:complete len:322 (-),score=58.35 TRINITY_DN65342_c0_g1_i1:689-1654(-)
MIMSQAATVAFIVVCLASIALEVWALHQLYLQRKRLLRRLFWYQLVTLLVNSVCWDGTACIFKMMQATGDLQPTDFGCVFLKQLIVFFEFWSCMLAALIAAGFAISVRQCCCTSRKGSRFMASVLMASLPGSALLSCLLCLGMNYEPDCGSTPDSNALWSIVVLTCCIIASGFYGCTIVRVARGPAFAQSRALGRGLGALTIFLVTFVPHAVQRFLDKDDIKHGHDAASFDDSDNFLSDLLYCNGAANAVLFSAWIRKAGVLEERAAAPDATATDVEANTVEGYFDIFLGRETEEAGRSTALRRYESFSRIWAATNIMSPH